MRLLHTFATAALALTSSYAQNSACFDDANFWVGDVVTGDTLQIEPFGIPAVGESITMQTRNVPPGAIVGLFLRAGTDGRIIEPLLASDASFTTTSDAFGRASVSLPIPSNIAPGSIFDFQYAALDPVTFEILTSEVLRVRTMLEPDVLFSSFQVSMDAKLDNFAGGDGVADVEGGMALAVVPGAVPGELIGEISEFVAFSPGTELSRGLQTGLIQVRLAEPLSFTMTAEDMVSFSKIVTMDVTFPGLMESPDHPELAPGDTESTPAPVEVQGVLSLQYGSRGGTIEFSPIVSREFDGDLGMLTLEGGFEVEAEICHKGKVPKKEVKIKVTIVKKAGAAAPRTQADIDAMFTLANDIFCKQCCIKLTQDGATTTITNTDWADTDFIDRGQMIGDPTVNDPNAINVYFTETVTSSTGAGVNGVTRGGGSADPNAWVGAGGNTNTMAHELGHALGLGHKAGSTNLMYDTGNTTKRKLSKSECNTARGAAQAANNGTFCKPAPEGV